MDPSSVMWRQAAAHGAPFDHDPRLAPQPFSLPIPNAALREASSVAALDYFYAIGEAWAAVVSHFLPAQAEILDIGCGCGKLARFLYLNPGVRYVGIDLFKPAIDWCNKAFSPLAGDRFRFEHFDGYSAVYNSTGTIKPREYRLPCASATIDMTVCASLFTHLLMPDCVHYLSEIARVLKSSGLAIISLHTEPAAGTRFSGDEARIDVDPTYFAELASDAGLELNHDIGKVFGQQLYLFQRSGRRS